MLALFVAVAIQAPDLTKKVTFTSVAKPMRRIVEEMAPKAGFPLMVSTVVGEEVVVIRLNEVPIGDAMTRIAAATSGEWQPENGGFRLIRSAVKAQQQEQEALAKRTEEMRKSLLETLKKGSPAPLTAAQAEQVSKDITKLRPRMDTDEFDAGAWNQVTKLERATATGRLMHKLIGLMDAREVAMIEPGSRVVFSTSPNPMQRPFHGNTRPALAAYVADHNVWAEASKRTSDVDSEDGFSWSQANTEPIQGGIKKALLVVMIEDSVDSVHLELKVFDEKDGVVGELSQSLSDYEEMDPAEMAARMKEAKERKVTGTQIEVSEISKQYAAAMESRGKSAGPVELPEQLRQALLNPEEHDPLSFVVSDALLGLAKLRGKNLVASLPDDAVGAFAHHHLGKHLTDNFVLDSLKRGHPGLLVEDETWMVVSPTEPVAAREKRMNRQALGVFLRASTAKGLVAIDDAAKLALAIKDPFQVSEIVGSSLDLLVPEADSQWSDSDLNLLRLYGSLSTTHRFDLQKGGRVAFGQMSQAQKLYLGRMVFGRYTHFSIGDEVDFDATSIERLYELMDEATELLPSGLVPTGYFTMKSEDRPVLYATSLGEYGWTSTLTAEDLAHDIVHREDPERHPWIRHMPQYTQFRTGNQLRLNFTFHVTPQMNTDGELRENRQPATAKPVGYNQLPADVRAEVEKSMAEYRKMFEDMPRERRGQRKPPPPPR